MSASDHLVGTGEQRALPDVNGPLRSGPGSRAEIRGNVHVRPLYPRKRISDLRVHEHTPYSPPAGRPGPERAGSSRDAERDPRQHAGDRVNIVQRARDRLDQARDRLRVDGFAPTSIEQQIEGIGEAGRAPRNAEIEDGTGCSPTSPRRAKAKCGTSKSPTRSRRR